MFTVCCSDLRLTGASGFGVEDFSVCDSRALVWVDVLQAHDCKPD